MDAAFFKIKHEDRHNRAVYTVLGVDMQGRKDLLGTYIEETEGAPSGWACSAIYSNEACRIS
ncbi:MAG: transposase [Flavobacteriales bacterium]|nr:transposase [Flavobacteriales bacterium]